jgi:sodium/hydrogen exchanger 8
MVFIHSRFHIFEIFPESIWAIFIGIGIGFLIQTKYGKDTHLEEALEFEPQAFFLFLLPPIMFQAGFSMSTRTFLKNILTINAYAIGATIIASFIFSLIFYYGMLHSDIPIPYIDSLHFGCFISAIDPVATISIFKSMNVNDKVYMIVFGESTLNDAVAIALSSSAESVRDTLNHGQEPHYSAIVFDSIIFFTVFFVGSIIVGIFLGVISSFLFAKLDLQRLTWLEVGLFLQCSYLPYICAEAMNLSGILAILIAGIIMRNYAYFSLSPYGQITIDHLVESIGYM